MPMSELGVGVGKANKTPVSESGVEVEKTKIPESESDVGVEKTGRPKLE